MSQALLNNFALISQTVRHKSTAGRGSNSKIELAGIKKLRELILELAVRGKLVPQDPSDEPASELLKRIEAEKARLIKEGKLKKQKPLPEISEEEKPFTLPKGWEPCRLGTLTEMFNGRAFKSTEWSDSGIPIVRIQNLNDPNASHNYFSGNLDEKNLINNGTFLISWSGTPGTSFGAFIWERGTAALNQHINKCCFFYKDTNLSFMKISVNGKMSDFIRNAKGGVGLKHVTKGILEEAVLALPPLAEQQRIVAKVDELMALCDQLEIQTETQLQAHQQLVETLLATLTNAQHADELSDNWQRLAAHFDVLFSGPMGSWAIDRLKDCILQLAVMGKLVPQNPNDEPASELLTRIEQEKVRLIGEGKIKKQKPLPPVSDDEKPFELPQGWEWSRAIDISTESTSGSTPPKAFFNDSEGAPYLKVYNIRNQKIDFAYRQQFVQSEYHKQKLTKSILYPGDVVMNIVGPPLGKIAVIPNTYPEWNCNQAIVFFRLVEPRLNKFLYLYLTTGIFLKDLELIGTAGQDNISVSKSRNLPIAIPPLAEQHRIVAKVDELFALCDQLKERLQHASDTQLNLTEAIVEQALN